MSDETATNEKATTKICIIGGGAAGIGLVWNLARATQRGLNPTNYDITVIHDKEAIGGHSWSQNVELAGATVSVDCGVQVIAPKWYPITVAMLALPEFAGVGVEPVEMRIACAFPGDGANEMISWGNFGDALDTPLAKSGAHDCQVFEDLLAAKFSLGWALSLTETVDVMLKANEDKFDDLKHFVTYFLDGYMSVLNGYGNADLDQIVVADLAALWDLGYASFLSPIEDYGRFTQGAMQWVNRMWSNALQVLGADHLRLEANSTVTELYPAGIGGPKVVTTVGSAPRQFDVVVSTVDMRGNANMLQNSQNALWTDVYEPAIGTPDADNYYGTSVWKLNPGFCILHQDTSFFAKTHGNEVMQFNTLAGRIGDGPGFELANSHSTYRVSQLNGIPDIPLDEDWFVSMYGFVPDEDKRPKKAIWSSPWTHGMFLPTFYIGEKFRFHAAQGASPYESDNAGKSDTGLYFAGNNLVMDSEEGALISGMAIAKYAFGLDPIALLEDEDGSRPPTLDLAEVMFDVFYDGLMFPSESVEIAGALAYFLERWLPAIGLAGR